MHERYPQSFDAAPGRADDKFGPDCVARGSEYLRALADSGVGLLLVTHHLDDIIPKIERVVLLRVGAIYADGVKTEVLTAERLSAIFGVPVVAAQRNGFYHAW